MGSCAVFAALAAKVGAPVPPVSLCPVGRLLQSPELHMQQEKGFLPV